MGGKYPPKPPPLSKSKYPLKVKNKNRDPLVVVVDRDKTTDDGQNAHKPECWKHDNDYYVNYIRELGKRPVENSVEILWKSCGRLWKKRVVGKISKSS